MLLLYIAGWRLRDVHVGATDVVPRDQEVMKSGELNIKECDFHSGPVPDAATVRIDCPSGEATGRFLVVQLSESQFFSLCEVTAAGSLG